MNIQELIEQLEEMAEKSKFGLDTEITVHHQPNYPLAGSLVNARMLGDAAVLAVGSSTEYGSSAAWDEAGDLPDCVDCGEEVSDEDDEICEDCQKELDNVAG